MVLFILRSMFIRVYDTILNWKFMNSVKMKKKMQLFENHCRLPFMRLTFMDMNLLAIFFEYFIQNKTIKLLIKVIEYWKEQKEYFWFSNKHTIQALQHHKVTITSWYRCNLYGKLKILGSYGKNGKRNEIYFTKGSKK